eukprot:GHVS01007372.1.p1 GENE.GHVS01007372.1~~GHVS01007372.1.p1  ORF type:complete len:214 (-),score=35.22 GHVS01007372.1:156-797(-)
MHSVVASDVESSFLSAVETMRMLGAHVIESRLPASGRNYWLDCYHTLAMCEAASNLSRYQGFRRYGTVGREEQGGACWGEEVKDRLEIGRIALSGIDGRMDVVRQAQSRVWELKNWFQDMFEQVDIMVSPTTPTTARRLSEGPPTSFEDDVFLVPASLAGLPALSLPARPSSVSSFPIGVQLIGRPLDEVTLLRVALAVEASLCPSHDMEQPP